MKRTPLKRSGSLRRHTRLKADPFKRYRTPEWEAVRREVIERDGWCQGCGVSHEEVPLQAHHKVYSEGDDPKQMQALCRECHEKLGHHPKGGIYYVYQAHLIQVDHCPRCAGKTILLGYFAAPCRCMTCDWSSDLVRAFQPVTINRDVAVTRPQVRKQQREFGG